MKKLIAYIYTYRWLLCIIVLAVFLRFIKLGETPVSIDWDEAALGYNAYSILKTGKDEYGTWFPLVLRSFDDYKPPLYVYLTIPSVAIFGLTPWSVRLPSAIFGVLAGIGTYFLTRALYMRTGKNGAYGELVALGASFLLAISPWNIQFSRIAFEANIGITLNIWSVYFLLKGLREGKFLLISAFFAGIALYAYHSERIFLPLLFLLLLFVFRKELLKQKRSMIWAGVVGAIVVLPLVWIMTDSSTWMRLRGTSALSDEVRLLSRSVRKLDEDAASGNFLGQVFDNRRVVWAQTIANGYLAHFSIRWLFLTGDNDRHHAPDMGLLYIWELPFLLWGIYEIARHGGTFRTIVFGWFLFSPVAASVTSEVPHAIRSMVFLPMFQIFTAVGCVQCIRVLRTNIANTRFGLKRAVLAVGIVMVGGVILFNIAYYLSSYFIHMNREFSRFWQYGYKEAVEFVQANRHKYTKVIVSPKLEQPHMFFLFFTKYDPQKYLEQGGTHSGGFAENMNRFDIFEFRLFNWDSEVHDGKTLYIGTPLEISGTPIHLIRYLDSSEAIKIAE